jgi:hypothetical protein
MITECSEDSYVIYIYTEQSLFISLVRKVIHLVYVVYVINIWQCRCHYIYKRREMSVVKDVESDNLTDSCLGFLG